MRNNNHQTGEQVMYIEGNKKYKGLPPTADEKEWMKKESKISGDPQCDRYGVFYRRQQGEKIIKENK